MTCIDHESERSESSGLRLIALRGRAFTCADLLLLRECVNEKREQGRTAISKLVCHKLGWFQPNGWMKDRACREVLSDLHRLGIISLPTPRVIRKCKEKRAGPDPLLEYDLETPVVAFPGDLQLVTAKGNKAEAAWNEMVRRYHYLGHKATVGRCLKYLAISGARPLAAISFSSPAWKMEARDTLLREIGIQDIANRVVNNTRFLVMPGVKVPHFASHLLSLASKRVVVDWAEYYSVIPLVAETFVQPSLYDGTCYKAANWVEVGLTKGFAKRGRSYRNSQEPKKILLYGLDRRTRSALAKAARTKHERK